MDLGSHGSRKRCLLVWSCATSALTGIGRVAVPPARAGASALAHQRLDEVPLDRALVDLAAVLLLGCAAWLWLVTSYIVHEAARGPGRASGRLTSSWVPSGLRRRVLSACGIAIVGVLAQSAVGATAHAGAPAQRVHAIVHTPLTGLPLPDRAAVADPPQSLLRRDRRSRTATSVVVAPGDSLWSIAASTLPDRSPDAQIARRWRAIYAANRDRIGPDPDLIVPGLHLHLPRRDLP